VLPVNIFVWKHLMGETAGLHVLLGWLTGSILLPATTAVLKNALVQHAVDPVKAALVDRFRARFRLPDKDDIARAVRVAELQATQYSLRGYENLYKALRKGGEDVDQDHNLEQFIASVHHYLNKSFLFKLTVQLDEEHASSEALLKIEAGIGQEPDYSTEQDTLLDAVTAELEKRTGWKPLPPRFARLLRHGEGDVQPWLAAFRSFLINQIKVNRGFRDILQEVMLVEVRNLARKANITSEEIRAQLQRAVAQQQTSVGTLGERLDCIENSLLRLYGSMEAYNLEFGNLDSRLVGLLEKAGDSQALSDALQPYRRRSIS
jgi:hypothetical protein